MEFTAENAEYYAAVRFLLGRINYERAPVVPYHERHFKLDRMRDLLARLDHPQDALRIVHIAGTKGKGSTASMLAAALTEAGYRTGVYTSPHLHHVEERFAVGKTRCKPEQLIELVESLRPTVEAMDQEAQADGRRGPTYFEITTAMALLHFVRERVSAAVVEVGLGGRLDSTNVCQPLVSVITSISYDHTRQLGNTLAQIAREKAGIIKKGIPVVSGVVAREPREVIEEVARQQAAPTFRLGREFDFRAVTTVPAVTDHAPLNLACGELDYIAGAGDEAVRLHRVGVGLAGRHQMRNAAVTIATLQRLREQGWNVPDQAIHRGLADVQCPARVEVVRRRPDVIIDAAHNVASTEALVEALKSVEVRGRRTLIFATSQDKDAASMLRCLLPQFDRVLLTRYRNNPRTVSPAELQTTTREALRELALPTAPELSNVGDPERAWHQTMAHAQPEDLICVTGSFFIAGELRSLAIKGATPQSAAERAATS